MLGEMPETVRTGASVPFGTAAQSGQVVPGLVKCTASVMRLDPRKGWRSRPDPPPWRVEMVSRQAPAQV